MKAIVNDRFEYSLSGHSEIDILERQGSHYLIRYKHRNVRLELLEYDHRKKTFLITLEGFIFKIDLSTPLDHIVKDIRAHAQALTSGQELLAPIPGLIKTLSLSSGVTVEKGETLLVLEAMKMENTIVATADGNNLTYYVAPGDHVVKGQILCSLE